ncbi:MAG TPA: TRAP transporter substrate-binding protein, partial [Chloroflexota bacterium]|nr:TRAP transporter substrate-binding protein [Chloroflexota bacterium]
MFKSLSAFISAAVCLTLLALLVACSSTPATSPTAAPAKPAEPTKVTAPAATAAAPAAAATKPAAAASFPKTTLKMGYTHNTDMSAHKGSVRFAELVKERTGGAVEIQIFPNGQLGNEKDQVEQVKNGVIHLDNVSASQLANFEGWGPVAIFNMPYFFKAGTEEEQSPLLLKLSRSAVMTDIAETAAKTSGIRALDMGWWYGQRHTTTSKKQILKADDLKGMKIRTQDALVAKLAMQALGASVSPMAMTELYSALQMGVVDGQENPINTIYTSKFYEIQKYLALTGHMTQNMVTIINDKSWQGFSPELKAVFTKAVAEAGDYQTDMQIKANKQNLEDLKGKGMIVSAVDKKEFADKTKDAWKEFEPLFG